MKLAFNFKNQLFWIHNFLPPNTYKQMYVDLIKNRNKLDFKKTGYGWLGYKEEEENSTESYLQDKNESHKLNNFLKEYNLLLKHQPFVNLMNLDSTSHIRRSKYGQHVTWHIDGGDNRKYGATFYFNKTWNESWGGEFMFKSDQGSGFIPVVGNSIVIVKSGLRHKVNANLKKTHPRFTIQTWINEKQIN